MNETKFLEKPSSMWMAIATMIIGFAVALASLQGGREVNASNIADLRTNYATINAKLDKIIDRQTQIEVNQSAMKTDIEYIKKAVIVVQEK